jgi:hypothetical protein
MNVSSRDGEQRHVVAAFARRCQRLGWPGHIVRRDARIDQERDAVWAHSHRSQDGLRRRVTLESTGAPSFPLSGGGLLLRPGRMRDVKLLNALFDTAIPLVPRNRSADMVPASALACSRDFLLRLAVSHDTSAWAPSRGEGPRPHRRLVRHCPRTGTLRWRYG